MALDLDRRLQRLEVASHNCYIAYAKKFSWKGRYLDSTHVWYSQSKKVSSETRSTAQMSTSVRPWYAA